jgi:hypothetical protein
MNTAPLGKWSPEQMRRLDEFNTTRSVDIHCHCLPGLDDGPATMSEALALCEALVADGITTVIATPHQLGRYDRLNSASQVREAVATLCAAIAEPASNGRSNGSNKAPRCKSRPAVCSEILAGEFVSMPGSWCWPVWSVL